MKSGPKVFVVDDEPVISTTLAIILRQSGFDVDSFTVPTEALKAAKLNPPHLLISDVMMPELSGVDLAIGIREIYPECRILLVSGQAATSDLLKESRKKGYDFKILLKPVHPVDLLTEIRRIES